MCGICGIWGSSEPARIEKMVDALRHRGPDDRGSFTDTPISMGMARLAVIDITPTGHQPMCTPDQMIWIVYNGEVYNFMDERQKLEKKGVAFRSTSDTEVILRLYEAYGDDFVLRLRGMFALAIYDRRRGPGRERLLLARDHLGIKPLLYSRVGNRLIFASEIKSLLASDEVRREIDPVSLRMLLTFGSIVQPRTILQNVFMLPPAHRMIVENGQERIERYWKMELDRVPGLKNRPYPELVEQVAAALEESVRLQMVSDVPIGAFLSGGVDSSFTVGLMTRIAGTQVKTFSVGFEAEGAQMDESGEAENTARFLGADHTRVVVNGDDMCQRLQHIVSSLDQPSVDGINSYFVSMAARQRVTVAISGTGGDELFAGYPWFTQMVKYERQSAAAPLRAAWEDITTSLASLPVFDARLCGPQAEDWLKRRCRGGFRARYAQNYYIYGELGAANLLSPAMRPLAQTGRAMQHDIRALDELPHASAVERTSALVLRGYTTNQLLRDIDATSMGHSLEVRVPFLDTGMLDLALSLPSSAKVGRVDDVADAWTASYRETGCKKILVDAGRSLGILPPDIDLQPKRGFSLPLDHWLRGPLHDVLEDTLSPESVSRRGWLDPQTVGSIRGQFFGGGLSWAYPWLLAVLELWARQIFDEA